MALEVNDFINAKCCRIVLDRVIDSRFDRTECEAGEEICDACEESRRIRRISDQQSQMIAMLDDSGSPKPPVSTAVTEQEQMDFSQRES